MAQQAGQAAVLGRLSISMWLWLPPPPPSGFGSRWGHTRLREGGGEEGANSDEGTDTLVLRVSKNQQLKAHCCRVKIPLFFFSS
jgi:hypothetical protein